MTADIASVHLHFGLGKGMDGKAMGTLRLDSESIDDRVFTPAALTYPYVEGDGMEVIRSSSGAGNCQLRGDE